MVIPVMEKVSVFSNRPLFFPVGKVTKATLGMIFPERVVVQT
jgi:hypothetical protein